MLEELLKRKPDGHVVSCYQKLEPGDRANDKYRIKLKNRLRRAAERLEILGFPHDDREAVKDALGRIEEFFRFPSNVEGGRGMAAFAANGYFRAVALPSVLRSRVLVDRTPVVGELVALTDASSRTLVVATDRKSARLFDVVLGQVTELPALIVPGATRGGRFRPEQGDAPGMGEFRFHTRIREEKHRHLERVAATVAARLRETPYDALLVGGIGVEASALVPHLSHAVTDRRAVGVVQFTPRQLTPAEISAAVSEFRDENSMRRATDDAANFRSAVGTGWGVDGVEPTLQALSRGQVATLLVDHDAEVPGFRLSKSGRLTTDRATSKVEGDPVPVGDVLDDAIEEALRQRARVSVLRGGPARHIDKLAGILRFQLPA